MSESDIIQKQRQIFRDFRLASSRRVNVESEAKKQFEEQRREAEQFLDGQKQRRLQMETEARKHLDDQHKAIESAMLRAKSHATTLLKQAQTALQEAQNALADFPHPITFKAKTVPNPDVVGTPEIELQRSVKQAKQESDAVQNVVRAWEIWKESIEDRKRNIRYAVIGTVILVITIVIVTISSFHALEQHRQATAIAQAHATATAQTQVRATAFAQATLEAVKPTVTAIALVQSRASLPVHLQSLESKLGMEFVYIPEGTFFMGSPNGEGDPDEHPQHTVYLDAFWISKTEITNAQYEQCISAHACNPRPYYVSKEERQPNHPVIYVNWYDAQKFCKWAGLMLPTEAQWEKSARGPDGRVYPWGNDEPNCDKAQYHDCGGSTIAVGSKPDGASPYGVLDMAGNVREWVVDWYNEKYYTHSPNHNPTGPTHANFKKISRGGSWNSYPPELRTANRSGDGPQTKSSGIGIRCVYVEP